MTPASLSPSQEVYGEICPKRRLQDLFFGCVSGCWGATTYGLHGQRFNYLFHDGHVVIYRMKDTVGTGTLNAPKGMWTMKAGD